MTSHYKQLELCTILFTTHLTHQSCLPVTLTSSDWRRTEWSSMDWKVSAELALVHKETILNGSLIDKINIRYYFMLILPLIFWLGILFQSISYSCFEEPHLIFWEQCFDCNWGPLFGNLTLVLFTHVLFPFTKLSSIQDCFFLFYFYFLKYENWLLASAVSHRALCGEQPA